MSSQPEPGRVYIYKDGEEPKPIRDDPIIFEKVWEPYGWSLEPSKRKRRRERQRPPQVPVVPAELPLPRPRLRDEPTPGLVVKVNLTPAQMGGLLAGAVGATVTVGVVLHFI